MQVIRCLLELDANVDAPGPHGMSAAFFACSRGNATKIGSKRFGNERFEIVKSVLRNSLD